MQFHDPKTVKGMLTHSRIWAYAGDHNRQARKSLMLAITGQSLPIKKCGVNDLKNAAYAIAIPNAQGCLAEREQAFFEAIERL